jgi:muconate cycloisomerase
VYPFARGLKLTALNLIYARLLRISDLKVKGTGDAARDLDYVTAIRRAFPYPVAIRLDLNGSLDPTHAEHYFSQLLKAGVSWFEQPFAKNEWDASARFQQQFRGVAVLCADESVCTPADLERAIRERAFDAVNIRIGKNGGLLASMQIYQRAIAAGLQVQLGSLVGETSVLAFAGLHFSAATAPLVHYEGCFGKYLVKWDLVPRSLSFSRFGHVPLTRLPEAGLVPAFDLKRLERSAISSESLAGARRAYDSRRLSDFENSVA